MQFTYTRKIANLDVKNGNMMLEFIHDWIHSFCFEIKIVWLKGNSCAEFEIVDYRFCVSPFETMLE